MKNSKQCPYCDPILNHSQHYLERMEKLWELPARGTTRVQKKSVLTKVSPAVFRSLIAFGLAARLFRLSNPPAKSADGRVRLLVAAAKKKKIGMQMIAVFGRPSTLFVAQKENERIRFELLPTWPLGQRMPVNIDEKPVFKQIVGSKVKVPKGKVFGKPADAVAYANSRLKYPVVVKPASGSLSMHVTADIQNEVELKRAIKVAKIVARNFVVEEHIDGHAYRLLCIDGKLVAAGLRKPPYVVGDGKATIQQLTNKKNHQRKALGLKPIPLTTGLHQTLSNQELNLNSVLKKGQGAMLFNKVILAAGAEVEDVTKNVHPEFIMLAEKAAKLIDLPVVGFDLITKDISKSSSLQKYGFIEANSMPFFDMHKGADKIAEQIWDIAFNKKSTLPPSSSTESFR